MNTGQFGQYYWVESADPLPLLTVALPFHTGMRLCTTSFDSGPLTPGPEELAAGWASVGEIVVSPPITSELAVPQGEYDEWYILTGSPTPDWRPEVFVNYAWFTLTDRDGEATQPHSDWLRGMQERFWAQIGQTSPISYLASGGLDVAVSQDRDFIDRLCSGLAPSSRPR